MLLLCWGGSLPMLFYENKAIKKTWQRLKHTQGVCTCKVAASLSKGHTPQCPQLTALPPSCCITQAEQRDTHAAYCTPDKTIILHGTFAVAVNNTESAGGELVILLTLAQSSLSFPLLLRNAAWLQWLSNCSYGSSAQVLRK